MAAAAAPVTVRCTERASISSTSAAVRVMSAALIFSVTRSALLLLGSASGG
jgi:hypothetical protein